ncbi:hypothetical protein MNEG_3615, partial [Monoraphidium neglectum]
MAHVMLTLTVEESEDSTPFVRVAFRPAAAELPAAPGKSAVDERPRLNTTVTHTAIRPAGPEAAPSASPATGGALAAAARAARAAAGALSRSLYGALAGQASLVVGADPTLGRLHGKTVLVVCGRLSPITQAAVQ